MPAGRRLRFAALLCAAALSGGALASCSGRENETQGNQGPQQATGTIETNPSTLGGTGTTEPTVSQPQHSVTSTQPTGGVTQPTSTQGVTNNQGG